MSVADELSSKACHFYALAHATANPNAKHLLLRLAYDYFKQSQELKLHKTTLNQYDSAHEALTAT